MSPKTSSKTDRDTVSHRVASKIKPASELEQYARMLFYGRSGAGKTRTVATAPKILLIDVNEKGTDSVRRDYNPNVYPVEYWSEVNDVYWYLQSGDHPYKCYAIDGVTGMQTLCMKFVLGDEAARDAARDPDMPSRAVWGKVGELMKTQITNYRNLPMHGMFTALQRTKTSGEEEEDIEPFTSPACSPSISGHLEAAVSLIGYLQNREVIIKGKDKKRRKVRRRRLMVGPNERYLTKDRYGVFGEYIDAPDVAKMIDQIYKEED